MGYFDGLIGIRALLVTGSTGVNIDDIPGLDVDSIDKSNPDYADVTTLINTHITRGWELMAAEIISGLNYATCGHSILDSQTTDNKDRDPILVSKGVENKGVLFHITNKSDFKLWIKSATIWSAETVNGVDIKVFDVRQGAALKTVTTNLTADTFNEVPIDHLVRNEGRDRRIIVFADSTKYNAYKVVINSNCVRCGRKKYIHPFISVEMAKKLSSQLDFEFITDTHGMLVDYSLSCDYEKWVRRNSEIFKFAAAYRGAIEIVKEAIYSKSRLNDVVTVFQNDNEDLITQLQKDYEKKLNEVLKYMKLPGKPCFTTNKRIERVI